MCILRFVLRPAFLVTVVLGFCALRLIQYRCALRLVAGDFNFPVAFWRRNFSR
jgi:hypothetical protein